MLKNLRVLIEVSSFIPVIEHLTDNRDSHKKITIISNIRISIILNLHILHHPMCLEIQNKNVGTHINTLEKIQKKKSIPLTKRTNLKVSYSVLKFNKTKSTSALENKRTHSKREANHANRNLQKNQSNILK